MLRVGNTQNETSTINSLVFVVGRRETTNVAVLKSGVIGSRYQRRSKRFEQRRQEITTLAHGLI